MRQKKKKAVSTALKQIWVARSGHMGSSYRDRRQHPSPRQVPGCPWGGHLCAVQVGGPGISWRISSVGLAPPPHPATRAVPLASRSALSRATVMGAEITIFTDRTSSHRKCLSSAHGPKTSWKTKENECCRYIPGTWRTRGSQASKVWSTRYVSRAKGSGQRASPAVVP